MVEGRGKSGERERERARNPFWEQSGREKRQSISRRLFRDRAGANEVMKRQDNLNKRGVGGGKRKEAPTRAVFMLCLAYSTLKVETSVKIYQTT
jgi:hypothetical protein